MKKTIMLKKNYEFKKIFSKGKYYSGQYIGIFVQKNNENSKLGIAIGVKVGKAFRRNQIKRFIRESYTLLENNIKNNYTVVVIWKKNADTKNATYTNILKDFKYLLKKAKLIEE